MTSRGGPLAAAPLCSFDCNDRNLPREAAGAVNPTPPLFPDLQLSVLLRVEAHGLDGGHHHDHAQRHRHEQHDHVLRPVFQGQLLLQA